MKILTPARVTVLMLMVVGGLAAAYVAKNLLAADTTPPKVETRTVPMAVADLKPGTVVTEPVSLVDVLPTILGAAGIEPPLEGLLEGRL